MCKYVECHRILPKHVMTIISDEGSEYEISLHVFLFLVEGNIL